MSNQRQPLMKFGRSSLRREPDNPRTSMEPSALEPDDARKLFYHLVVGIRARMNELSRDKFTDSPNQPLPTNEKAKQHYGNDEYQLLAGIEAALREWDESGQDVQELKEKYGGTFVEGVEIGERLAVYEGRDFTFVE